MVQRKKPDPRKKVDVLESRNIHLAEDFFEGEEGYKIPQLVKSGWKDLRAEIFRLRREVDKDEEKIKYGVKKSKESNGDGHHPAITGLTIGGAKEVIDYIFDIASAGDKVAQGFLDLPFIDGGITAIIATCAAFFAKGSRSK